MSNILSPKDECRSDLNCVNFEKHIQHIRNLDLRPDDVVLAGFPRTGKHWFEAIVYKLLEGRSDLSNMDEILDYLDPSAVEKFGHPEKPCIFVTHHRHCCLPLDVWNKKIKVIYVERNPKDTWVSMYNYLHNHAGVLAFTGTWNEFFEVMMDTGMFYGNWFDYVLDWENIMATDTMLTIMRLTYEDLKKNPVEQIEKLDNFLGLNRGRELCELIADAFTYTSLTSAREAAAAEEERKRLYKNKSIRFYRRGEIAEWKKWFTNSQNTRFDAKFADRMVNSTLSYIYE